MLFSRFLLTFICLLVVACSAEQSIVSDDLPFCTEHTVNQDDCRFSVGEASVWISSSNTSINTEQKTQLLMWSDKPVNIISAEIRGVNMYMGRLPVEVRSVDNQTWTADFMLGACTEPRMVWELLIRLESGADTEYAESTQTLRIPFVTSR